MRSWLRSSTDERSDTGGSDRIVLRRSSPVVSLNRVGAVQGALRVNLQWSAHGPLPEPRTSRSGFLAPRRLEAPSLDLARGVDLDLGCFYEMASGQRGVVQALGSRYGAFDRPPFLRLDQDDRSGTASGENLFVNLDHVAQFRRLLIFVFIYSGAPAFAQAQGVVTLFPSAGPSIEIRLDERAEDARSCAVALIAMQQGDVLVRREMRYVRGYQEELDSMYRWGMRWGPGVKTH